MNNKVLLAFIVAFSTCCIGGIWVAGKGLSVGKNMQASAKRWADKELPPLMQHWNWAEIQPRCAPEWFKHQPEADVRKVIEGYLKVPGKLIDTQPFEPQGMNSDFKGGKDTSVFVALKAVGRFEHTSGAINVVVVRVGNEWKIAHIDIPGGTKARPAQ